MFVTVRQIQLTETDSTGTIPLPVLVRWMEETEYAFLRSRNLSVSIIDDKGQLGFPRTNVELEIFQSAQAFDWVAIELNLAKIDGKRIEYSFRIFQLRRLPKAVEGELFLTARNWQCPNGTFDHINQDFESAATAAFETHSPLLARGEFIAACCRFPANQPPRAILIPEWIIARITSE